jgi:hypothetical protein
MLSKINKQFRGLFFITCCLLISPLFAEEHYIFPSDIVDQSEQAQFDQQLAQRYIKERQWRYPQYVQEVNKDYNNNTNKYSVDYQRNKLSINSSSLNQTQRYSYVMPKNKAYLEDKAAYYNPSPYRTKQTYTTPSNVLIKQKWQRKSDRYQDHSRILYPSDLINSYNNRRGKFYAEQGSYSNSLQKPPLMEYQKQRKNVNPIRYVAVPMYGVPRTLPGTVPGIITPRNMVPGYSHLSPNYNSSDTLNAYHNGGINFPSIQNNSFPALGAFSQGSKLFNSAYEQYNHHADVDYRLPLSENIRPNLLIPSMF